MAIYHHHAQVIGKSGGRSAVAAASYRSGERLRMVDGRVVDYSRRHGIEYTAIMAPERAADWMKERQTLWLGVESGEKRKDAQFAREVQISLPCELDAGEQVELVREYVQASFVDKGMVADIAIHDTEKENPHAHVMLTMREIDGEGFGKKNRDWNKTALLQDWRKGWAEVANKHLERAGHEVQIDHRSLVDQGISREPKNLSMAAHQMEAKGLETRQGEQQRLVQQRNAFARMMESANDNRRVREVEERERVLSYERGKERQQERERGYEQSR